jgi:membrane protein implicated in regulation of membrane protease activity
MDGDADLDHDAGFHLDKGDGLSALSIFAFIGVGKAPLFVVLIILFGTMGILGWIFNSLIESIVMPYPSLALLPVGVVALLGSSVISSRVTRFIGKVLPPISTTATRADALVGRQGVVLSPQVDGKYGLVRLRDKGGTSINVFAVVDSEEPIDRDNEVILVDYDSAHKIYTVTRR